MTSLGDIFPCGEQNLGVSGNTPKRYVLPPLNLPILQKRKVEPREDPGYQTSSNCCSERSEVQRVLKEGMAVRVRPGMAFTNMPSWHPHPTHNPGATIITLLKQNGGP